MQLFTLDETTGKLDEKIVPIDINSNNAAGEFEAFYEAVQGLRPLETPAIEGANTIAVCHAIMESADTGRPVTPNYFV